MKKTKRIIGMLLALSMLSGIIPAVAKEQEESLPALSNTITAAPQDVILDENEGEDTPSDSCDPLPENDSLPSSFDSSLTEPVSGFVDVHTYDEPLLNSEYASDFAWELSDDGTLTISGNGAMPDTPWSSCKEQIKKVVISEGITSICASAFFSCSSLTSITIPDSVTSIDYEAFSGCNALTTVNINDISAWCVIDFSSSRSNPLRYTHKLYINEELITDLIIPNNVTKISSYAFYGCSSLTSVTIPDSVTSIGYASFFGCEKLTTAGPIGGDYNIRFGWKTIIPNNAKVHLGNG